MTKESIRYRIEHENECFDFEIVFDASSVESVPPESAPPDWTRLGYHQCSNCPLDEADHPRCPLALRLAPLVTRMGHLRSHFEVTLEARAGGRTVRQVSTVQQSLGSLMGAVIATSGCPHTTFLKPMARFHQPLASPAETVYRAAAMYRLAQFFRERAGGTADPDMSGLVLRYRHLQIVNRSLADRVRSASSDDGAVNAVVLLDGFAKMLPLESRSDLARYESLFAAYLDDI
ncbi:MAG: DUF6901 family protein [Gammaproteobacteria bacterium]